MICKSSPAKPPVYRDLWVRIFLSLPAAHVVLRLNEPENFIELIQLPGYVPLLLQNWLWIFLIFSCVRSITVFLDENFAWAERLRARVFFQLFYGVGIPVLLSLVLASLYFSHHGLNLLDTGYLKLELWFSILFVGSLNCYYTFYYFSFSDFGFKRHVSEQHPVWALSRGNEVTMVSESEVALFYVEKGICVACLMNGDKYAIDRSIATLMEEANAERFFRINRSTLVNRRAIAGFKTESSNRLLLRLNIQIEEDFYVSQRNVREFKRWLG